jgi:hypothetical protein
MYGETVILGYILAERETSELRMKGSSAPSEWGCFMRIVQLVSMEMIEEIMFKPCNGFEFCLWTK